MTLETLRTFLGWCILFNAVFLLLWWGLFAVARGWILRLHGRWFQLDEPRFNAIHYAGLLRFKVAVVLFNVTPWLALSLLD